MSDRRCRLCGVQLLAGDDLLGRELVGAGEIGISLVGIGLGGSNLSVECGALARCALNLRLRLARESTAATCRFSRGEIRLHLLQAYAVVRVVELNE